VTDLPERSVARNAGKGYAIPVINAGCEEIPRAADIFLENGVYIETGPHTHAIQQTFFLYVWEPGGNRVEVANAGLCADTRRIGCV